MSQSTEAAEVETYRTHCLADLELTEAEFDEHLRDCDVCFRYVNS